MSTPALRILIVEDQFLIAKQLEMIVASAGHVVVGTADNSTLACDLALATEPDIVFIDLSLADGLTGMDVATVIADRCDAHVVFTTANRRRLPADFGGAIGLVEKPFTRSGLLSALHYLASHLLGARNPFVKPDSLLLSPTYSALWAGHP